MRKLPVLLALCAAVASSAPAAAQVTDAERSAARQLFKEGDDLQRAGKFAEALDKFERAQQVFSAPTNMLRIAECDAALGRLVESAESYRALVRTPLPPGSPPAFQAAVDQAKGELAQVEPRVPKLLIQVDPRTAPGQQLQIDGQAIPAALIGEPFPLDPGQHRVLVTASGYISAEQQVVLKERETKTLPVALRPIAGVTYSTGGAPQPPPPLPAPPPQTGAPADTAGPGGPQPPPPPPMVEGTPEHIKRRAGVSFLVGLHLGYEGEAGAVPVNPGGGTLANVDMSTMTGGGFAYALDAGVRFARQFYIGLTLEHAGLGINNSTFGQNAAGGGQFSSPSASTTSVGAALGLIVNPDRASLYLEAGLQERWYSLGWKDGGGNPQSTTYDTAELLLGIGLWLPAGRSLVFLPEFTTSLGAFSPPNGQTSSDGNPGHAFFMLGLAGFFNADL
jgi:opacity protein-like surface antigen